MKYLYNVTINTPPVRAEGFSYSYAQTNSIELLINKAGAKLTFNTGKDYSNSWDGSYAQRLVYDGIKRCALLYVMYYNTPILLKAVKITISSDNKVITSFDVTETVKFYSLIGERLQSQVGANLKNKDVLKAIISEMKKDYGKRTAALYAYLLSKTKTYEAEKFVYLWMAFNGVYSYWGQRVGIQNNDKDAIEVLLKKYGWGKEILNRITRPRTGQKASLIINHYEPITSGEDLNSEKMIDLRNEIVNLPGIKEIEISLYGYLLCDFCYYLRCTMIHASKPLPLFSFENDTEIKVLKVANNLLEEFLDNHLYECFEGRD
ncbi:MAG: hypothetical protein IJH53_09940 [Oscillospiraceae bacterium]|nr:hypothetical protein [Oscillospiraceae bacterium]